MRHHIPVIICSDGMLTFSAEEVGKEFVSYYKELLGLPSLLSCQELRWFIVAHVLTPTLMTCFLLQ